MRTLGCILLSLLVVSALAMPPAAADDTARIDTCFVPGPEDCAEIIVAEISRARHTIDVQAYNFTEPRIAQSFIEAQRRGVAVRIVLDKTAPRERGEKASDVAGSGIATYIDYQPRIAHNKIIVIDGQTVVGGSFNYTESADLHNAENVTIIRERATASAFERNFARRLAASAPYDATR